MLLLSTCYSLSSVSSVRTGFHPIGSQQKRVQCEHGSRRLALDALPAVVFLHLEIPTILPPAVPQLIFLKVDADVEVVVHAVVFVRLLPLGEAALQLLQLLRGQEVGLGKHHLEGKGPHLTFAPSA